MQEHRDFDDAIDDYMRWNNTSYSHADHVAHVREVMGAGTQLLRALGASSATPPNASLEEASLWAFQYFEAMDRANAQIHCAPVRYSPITFRLCLALRDAWPPDQIITETMAEVLRHHGAYQPDPGR